MDRKFVVDAMLGKLAKWLRILGFDTQYVYLKDPLRIEQFLREGRTIITRNQKWKNIKGVVCIESNHLEDQMAEVAKKIDFSIDHSKLFTRCIRCGSVLTKVDKKDVFGQVPDYILDTAEGFSMCRKCGKVFWPGSHIGRMREKISRLQQVIEREVRL